MAHMEGLCPAKDYVDPYERYFHSLFKIGPHTPEIIITRVHAPCSSKEKGDL